MRVKHNPIHASVLHINSTQHSAFPLCCPVCSTAVPRHSFLIKAVRLNAFFVGALRYMVASGLPECRDDHAEAVAEFALDLLDIVSRFNTSNRQVPHLNRPHIAVRAGIDTGPAIAGIIGDKKFCYDIWGAGVDGAIAMEQSGVANRIHLSQAAANRLGGLYHMDLRKHTLQMKQTKSTTKANLPVKLGVQTFFLTGRSKRVDFTRKAATSSRESARWDDRATKSLPGKRDDKGDQVSRGAISLGAANEVAPPPSRQPSVRVERHRRQSSTW